MEDSLKILLFRKTLFHNTSLKVQETICKVSGNVEKGNN